MDAKQKARIAKALGRTLLTDWRWTGSEFFNFGFFGAAGATAYVRFTAGYQSLKVEIEMKDEYGIPDKERTFTGATAITDSITWITDVLAELYDELKERTAPYVAGYINYKRALKGE